MSIIVPSRKRNLLVSGLRVCLSIAEIIGFSAQFITAVTVSVASKLTRSILRFILVSVSVAVAKLKRIYRMILQMLQSKSQRIITTIEKNGTTWIKIEVKGYSLLLGKRNVSGNSEAKEGKKSHGSTTN